MMLRFAILMTLSFVLVANVALAAPTPPEEDYDPAPLGHIKAIRFVGHGIAWAVRISESGGLELQRTTDNTRTWQTWTPNRDWAAAAPDTIAYARERRRHDALMLDLYAQDANTAWAVIGAKREPENLAYVLGTHDGGAHWTRAWLELANMAEVLNLQFVDAKNGFVYERLRPAKEELLERIYRTEDGGATWSMLALPDERQFPNAEWEGCTFRTPTDGWLTSMETDDGKPTLFCTHDAGAHWQPDLLEIPESLTHGRTGADLPQFFGNNKKDGVLMVSILPWKGDNDLILFYGTRDGGAHWTRAGRPEVRGWGKRKDCSFLDDGIGWLVVEKEIFRTEDYANTWKKIPATVPLWVTESGADEFQLRFVDHKIGWIFVPWFQNKLLRTLNGGKTWERLQ